MKKIIPLLLALCLLTVPLAPQVSADDHVRTILQMGLEHVMCE